jgi:cytochrome oxidase Cu insertion factor (SCO1/SenC/PrrC family)
MIRGLSVLLILTVSAVAQTGDELLRSRAFESGGDFALTDHHGERFRLSNARGKVALLFFGYTSCAEACPVAMAKIAAVYKRLGGGRKVATLFVSLDPARDTPAALARYLSHFSTSATGLTGKKEEIDAVVAQYGAKYEIERSDSALGYHINHSTYLYAIDSSGKVRFRFKHEDSAELIAAGVKRLLE